MIRTGVTGWQIRMVDLVGRNITDETTLDWSILQGNPFVQMYFASAKPPRDVSLQFHGELVSCQDSICTEHSKKVATHASHRTQESCRQES